MESSADFDNLLLWLGGNARDGAKQYIELRQKLVSFFEFRGCTGAEDLADETMDRTAHAILKPGFVCEGNPIAYLRGVARNVQLEAYRRARTVSVEDVPEFTATAAAGAADSARTEELHAYLEKCLTRLPQDKRSLLLRYYQGDKGEKIDTRLRLAKELSIELNTLRLQIFRLRNTVRKCVESCMKVAETESRI